MIALRLSILATSLALTPTFVHAADSLRAEVGQPLHTAQELVKQQKYREALAQVDAANAIADKSPYEMLVIGRMQGAAALGAGDSDLAAKAFTAVFASGRLSKDEMMKASQAVATGYYRDKQYAKVSAWVHNYDQYGGADPTVDHLLPQAEYLAGNYAEATRALQELLEAQIKAGRKPGEEDLQLLANCALKQKDDSAYQLALEQLLSYYPKRGYWLDAIARVQRRPGFPARLGLDIYRLKRVTGTLIESAEYVEMAELSLQAGLPFEAKQVLAEGYQAKVLGNGPEAGRQQRLHDLAGRQAAADTLGGTLPADADAKLNTGYTLVVSGKAGEGVALMRQGLAKGGLKHPEEARLHLGEALLAAGRSAEAAAEFASVDGPGAKALARLWSIQATRRP